MIIPEQRFFSEARPSVLENVRAAYFDIPVSKAIVAQPETYRIGILNLLFAEHVSQLGIEPTPKKPCTGAAPMHGSSLVPACEVRISVRVESPAPLLVRSLQLGLGLGAGQCEQLPALMEPRMWQRLPLGGGSLVVRWI